MILGVVEEARESMFLTDDESICRPYFIQKEKADCG